MELTYSTSRALVAEAYWRSLRRNPRHRLAWLAWVALAFTVGAVTRSPRAGIVASAGMVGFLALAPQLLFKPQQRVLRLGPAGLWTSIGTKTGERSWAEIVSVEREADHIIITGRNLNAFIIPVSAFPNLEASHAALTQWQEWQRGAAPPAA